VGVAIALLCCRFQSRTPLSNAQLINTNAQLVKTNTELIERNKELVEENKELTVKNSKQETIIAGLQTKSSGWFSWFKSSCKKSSNK
jgi:hypothetical protein